MNLINVWLALPLQKRLMSLGAVILSTIFFFMMTNIAMKPKLALLYSGVDAASAGEILSKLDGLGVAYDVRGDAIYTEEGRRDSLRLELAREGLPRQNTIGYELFDTLNSFAMSSDMFDTAYWRAKEGELARTILAMPNITGARVHLGTQKTNGFGRSAKALSASVTVSTGGGLSMEQAKAIQYLTALAVVGLAPEDVAVIDTIRGLLAGPGLQDDGMQGNYGELQRAADLKANLISMLEARVGTGNVRVNVSLDVDRQSETITERRFDPEGRVLKSQTTQETTGSSNGTNAAVTVASNLPEGEAGGGDTNSEQSETRETTRYEISEILTNKEIAAGQVKRMTIAVLISDVTTIGEDGSLTRAPRSEEELSVLRELVEAAAGIDEARGDQLTVRSLPFDIPEAVDLIAKPSLMDRFMDQYLWSTVQLGILAIVSLILGLFVVRPLLSRQDDDLTNPALSQLSPMQLGDGKSEQGLIQGGNQPLLIDGSAEPTAAENTQTSPHQILQMRASEDVDEAAELLGRWLEDDIQGAA